MPFKCYLSGISFLYVYIMKKLFSFVLLLPITALGETINAPQPIFFENNGLPKGDEPQIKTPQKDTALSPSGIEFHTLDNALAKLEKLINYGVVNQQWALLKQLLPLYQKQAGYDETLYRYAAGAMLRAENRYPEAIAFYQAIIKSKPELSYPRFDLGVMLFENKQYYQSQYELERAIHDLPPDMQLLAQRYLNAMKERQNWRFDVNVQYTQTDNVNNASSQRDIILGGRRFVKNEDSLPQKAHGVRYGLNLSRELNLIDNHFLAFNAGLEGVYYWDNQDYSEKSLSASFGYRHRSVLQSWGVVPFFEQNWLGAPRYSKNYGVSLDFRRELTELWALSGSISHAQKRYTDDAVANRYNGYINGATISLSYQVKPNWVMFGGLEMSIDRAKDKSESSFRRGVNVGSVWQVKDWGSRINVRYIKRDFRAENFYFPDKKRQDHEYTANISIWNNKLQWKGFLPKLNYRYRNIHSNIPEFYSRQNSEWFVSVEKGF